MTTLAFCPAAQCADRIARLEAALANLEELVAATSPGARADTIEAVRLDLTMEAEAARDWLAEQAPVSAAGAMAQLLAAIRDHRVGDAPFIRRARLLETRAIGFLAAVGQFEATAAAHLSQTRRTAAANAAQLQASQA